ncbi:MAG: M81 family metallopeptidase [Pseudomonadota bacterium]
MPRIAIAGFQHETNTFAPMQAGLRDFEIADSWPALLEGGEILPGTRGLNLPIAGFVQAAEKAGDITLAPLLWCAAEPAAHVTTEAFEAITARLLSLLAAAGPVDALFLDLHGAMVTEAYDDGEGALLARLRTAFGHDLPIAISLDLHANISPQLVELASIITIYRTYPHLDMAETGARALPLLRQCLRDGPPAAALRQAPFLLPLHAQHTKGAPLADLYAQVAAAPPGLHAELALGFTAADTPHTGPAVLAYGPHQAAADRLADDLLAAFAAAEPSFETTMLHPSEAVAAAMGMPPGAPVVIADVQDNPGAGATSDSTGLLTALANGGAEDALLALLDDPEMAARAHAAGTGASIEGALGGRSGVAGDRPFEGRFRVEALGDGQCRFTGAMYGGGTAVLGPTAVLRVLDCLGDVCVVVGSRRSQCLDLAIFTHIGRDPRAARIVGVKSTVHFRADFEPIAQAVLVAEAPGAFPCRLDRIPYRNLRPGLRLGPLGPAFARP